MSDQTPTGRQDDTSDTTSASPEVARIEADLEQTRERLAETVDALGAKQPRRIPGLAHPTQLFLARAAQMHLRHRQRGAVALPRLA